MSARGEAEVGDVRIEFLLDGAGDTVVLIPGGGQVSFLVVQGLKDRVAPPEHGRAFRERLGPRVQVAGIPDAGHMVFLEQPESVAEAVISFLRQQAA